MLDHFQKVWPFLPQLDQQIINFSFECKVLVDVYVPVNKINKYIQNIKTKPRMTPAL